MSTITLSQRARSPRKVFKLIALMFILVTVLCVRVSHADLTETAKLVPADGASSDYFGKSVSISGDYAIVGAPNDDDKGNASGSAYIFRRSGTSWTEAAKLVAQDGAALDTFGAAVSISGNYAIVGAPFNTHLAAHSGSAYIFERSGGTWSQQPKLFAPVVGDPSVNANDYFGASVSIDGGYAIVGVPFDDDSGADSGSAHIFVRTVTGWTHMAKLVASDGAAGDHFGQSVSISGNYAIVGAPWDDSFGHTNSGAVYLFERSGDAWNQVQNIVDLNSDDDDEFGSSVSINGDFALAGAYKHDDDTGQDVGSVAILRFWNNVWIWSAYIKASDRAASDQFGYSVSLSGDYAVIGTLRYFNASKLGTTYVFRKISEPSDSPVTEWAQFDKLIASDARPSYPWGFGSAVSVSSRYGIVGAQHDNVNGMSSGSTYVFDIISGPTPPVMKFVPAVPLLLSD